MKHFLLGALFSFFIISIEASSTSISTKIDQFDRLIETDKQQALTLGIELYPSLILASGDEDFNDLFREISFLIYLSDKATTGLSLNRQLLTHSQTHHHFTLEATAHNLLGIGYFYQGDIVNALVQFESSLAVLKQHQLDSKKIADLSTNIGSMYAELNQFDLAMEHHEKAYEYYISMDMDLDAADVLFNIVGILIRQGQFEQALSTLNSVEQAYLTSKDLDRIASISANRGTIYEFTNQLEQSKQAFYKALSIYKKEQNSYEMSSVFNNLASVFYKNRELTMSIEYARQSRELAEENGYSEILARTTLTLAKANLLLGDVSSAHSYALKSLTIAEQNQLAGVQLDLNRLLSLISQQQDAIESALTYSEKAEQLEEQIIAEKTKLSVALYQAKFESKIQDFDLKLLQQQRDNQQLIIQKNSLYRNALIGFFILLLIVVVLYYNRTMDRKANKLLEEKVRLRTEELVTANREYQDQELAKTKEIQKKANSIRSEVTGILGLSKVILSGDNPSELINEVKAIQRKGLDLLKFLPEVKKHIYLSESYRHALKPLNKNSHIPNILLVQKDPCIAKIIMSCLSPFRLKITLLNKFSALSSHLQLEQFDLVIMSEPEIELRSEQLFLNIKDHNPMTQTLLVTFNSVSDNALNWLQAGADSVCILPSSDIDFISLVERFIPLQRSDSATHQITPELSYSEVVRLFKLSLSERVKVIRLGVGNRDYPSLLKECDELHQSAKTIGFNKLALKAEAVVKAVNKNEQQPIQLKVEELIVAIQNTMRTGISLL